MIKLAGQVTRLHHNGITLANVMVVPLCRGIQSLQEWAHPMWEYNNINDSTRAI